MSLVGHPVVSLGNVTSSGLVVRASSTTFALAVIGRFGCATMSKNEPVRMEACVE
jgi:hypothetical protein